MTTHPFESYLQTRPTKQRIFDALRDNPHGLTKDELAAVVWQGSREPDWAISSLHVHLSHMRRAMRRLIPWLTISSLRRSGRRFLLVIRRPRGDAYAGSEREHSRVDDSPELEGPQPAIPPGSN